MSKADSETVTKGIDLEGENSLLNWVRKADDSVQQLFEGDETKDVIFTEIEKDYEIFTTKGCYAKICVDDFENQPIKVDDMRESMKKDGTKKENGDEADMYMSAYCFNKITALKDEKVGRDPVWKLKNFLHEIVFGGMTDLRDSPPAGISKETTKAIHFQWESYKYTVKMTKDAYRKLEVRINKILKKANKSKSVDDMRKAESVLVQFLQKNLKLKTGQSITAIGFANYYTVMFKAIFPSDFGTDTRIKKLKEDGDW